MDALKGIAEVIDHILYEILGLVIPGAALLLIVTRLLGTDTWNTVITFGEKRLWLAFGAVYVLGYVVQGVSRPVVGAFDWLLGLPARLLGWPVVRLSRVKRRRIRRVGIACRKVGRWIQRWSDRQFLRRHRPANSRVPRAQAVDLKQVAQERWRARLGLPDGRVLSARQLTNLSFSVLLQERARLDRYRAATSLCRGVAVGVAAALSLVVGQLVVLERTPTPEAFLLLAGLVIAFYALLERADFYNELWEDVLQPQFLAHDTRADSPQT